jgi:hypothetical protein
MNIMKIFKNTIIMKSIIISRIIQQKKKEQFYTKSKEKMLL